MVQSDVICDYMGHIKIYKFCLKYFWILYILTKHMKNDLLFATDRISFMDFFSLSR